MEGLLVQGPLLRGGILLARLDRAATAALGTLRRAAGQFGTARDETKMEQGMMEARISLVRWGAHHHGITGHGHTFSLEEAPLLEGIAGCSSRSDDMEKS